MKWGKREKQGVKPVHQSGMRGCFGESDEYTTFGLENQFSGYLNSVNLPLPPLGEYYAKLTAIRQTENPFFRLSAVDTDA